MREEKSPDRNWKEYNEKLVQKGGYFLAVGSLEGWKEELKETNFNGFGEVSVLSVVRG